MAEDLIGEPDITLGWQAQVEINGQNFAVVSGGVDCDADEHECGDSVRGRRKAFKGGRQWFSANIDFQEDENVALHTTPLLIQEGDLVSFIYYPEGIGGDNYAADNFVVLHFHIGHDINGKVTGSISGKCADGVYTKAGE